MITTSLLGIQGICIAVSAYLTYKTSRKSVKLQLVEKGKGFKHYKTGGL